MARRSIVSNRAPRPTSTPAKRKGIPLSVLGEDAVPCLVISARDPVLNQRTQMATSLCCAIRRVASA